MNVRQLVMSPSHDTVRITDSQTQEEVDDFSADAEFSFLSLQHLTKYFVAKADVCSDGISEARR